MGTNDNKQRIVVIGGAGYLGSVLTGQLLEQGFQVEVFDSLRFGEGPLSGYSSHPGFKLTNGDIRHIDEVSDCVKGSYGVVLLASLVGEPACDKNPQETEDINFLATKSVAETCRYHGIERFIFASTDSAYGIQEGIMYEDSPMAPISLYGQLKVQSEHEIMTLADDIFKPTILRMATIYGLSPRMRFDLVVNVLTLNAHVNEKITIHGGAQWRPLVHVADAARAYVMCLQSPLEDVGGEIFNVGSNEQNYQIGHIGDQIKSVFHEVDVETVPQVPDLRDYYVNFDKITNILGYQVQYSVADGIREIYSALDSGAIKDHTDPRHYNAR